MVLGKSKKHDPHSAPRRLLARQAPMQQVDDCVIYPNARTTGELQQAQGGTVQCAEVVLVDPFHGLREVGGQGDKCAVVQGTKARHLRDWYHTRGLPPQDWHRVQAQAEHVPDHLTELVLTLPEQPGTGGIEG